MATKVKNEDSLQFLQELDMLHLLYQSSADNFKINKKTCAKLYDAVQNARRRTMVSFAEIKVNILERKAATSIYL